jgi:hypothetical protein
MSLYAFRYCHGERSLPLFTMDGNPRQIAVRGPFCFIFSRGNLPKFVLLHKTLGRRCIPRPRPFLLQPEALGARGRWQNNVRNGGALGTGAGSGRAFRSRKAHNR